MNNDKCKHCGRSRYDVEKEGGACFGRSGVGPHLYETPPPQEEPYVSIEGVLWDIHGGVMLVEEGIKRIREYVEVDRKERAGVVVKKLQELEWEDNYTTSYADYTEEKAAQFHKEMSDHNKLLDDVSSLIKDVMK